MYDTDNLEVRARVTYSWDLPETAILAADRGTLTVTLNHNVLAGYSDEEAARRIIATRRTGIPGNAAFVVIESMEVL